MKHVTISLVLAFVFISSTAIALAPSVQPGVVYFTPERREPQTPAADRRLEIRDNQDNVIWSIPMTTEVVDFKRQPGGELTYIKRGDDAAYVIDHFGNILDTYVPITSQDIDPHDFLIEDGNAWLLALDIRPITIPDEPTITVTGFIIESQSVPTKELGFYWNSWDHIPYTHTVFDIIADQPRGRYIHINSLDIDDDGNIIFSARHLNQVVKIDRQTGDIIWRMGEGVDNDFTLTNDARWFSYQHTARRLDNGNLLLFDNGNLGVPQYSRAVEYNVDEANFLITKTWEYSAGGAIFNRATGSAQRLANGNTLIGWGRAGLPASVPNAQEVTPAGDVVAEWYLPDFNRSYRAFKGRWVHFLHLPIIAR